MDEFLSQFLVESRELVDQAMDDLLALEKSPHDRERFDDAFRAFHTLKGGAAIIEFAAMQEALHCAEDVLATARSHSAPVYPADIGDCLFCLDRIIEWLDAIETTGALPSDADASVVVARFKRAPVHSAPTAQPEPAGAWITAALSAHAAAAGDARTAVRYRPDTDSFYRHEDPLERVAMLPGLLTVDIEPRSPWPTLEELDPFACNLTIVALTSSSSADVVHALGDAIAQCEVEVLRAAAPGVERRPQSSPAREVLAAQLQLLHDTGERLEPGTVASAGLVAANVLHRLGRRAEAEQIAAITAACVERGTAEELRETLAGLVSLETTPKPAPSQLLGTRQQTLRVSAVRVDALVRLTGELAVAKNAIGHVVKLAETRDSSLASALKDRHAALDRLIGEIQRSVLALRVLPLRAVFQRFPRLVRELAADLHKPATLVFEGEETEADKTIVELLAEPLVHVLRNAMDHGIEDAAARASAGKPPVATIRMRALREGEHVLIEVTDDGGGIDTARVREAARQRNVATADALASMSDSEVTDLIFAPGFSTATVVTELSGRGVGLDAVRTAAKRLGGHVAVTSSSSSGTTVRFTLPFSIMMTQVMTVEAGGQLFGIPLDAVVEAVRVPRADIFPVGAARAIVLRDRTIPLIELGSILGAAPFGKHGNGEALVVIADVNGDLGALEVARVGERMDVMLKPLEGILAGLPGVAGSTLLGDGSVLLVLDLSELLQ